MFSAYPGLEVTQRGRKLALKASQCLQAFSLKLLAQQQEVLLPLLKEEDLLSVQVKCCLFHRAHLRSALTLLHSATSGISNDSHVLSSSIWVECVSTL